MRRGPCALLVRSVFITAITCIHYCLDRGPDILLLLSAIEMTYEYNKTHILLSSRIISWTTILDVIQLLLPSIPL